MAKRRIQKKHYRIVREALAAGKSVPTFPLFRVLEYLDNLIYTRYTNVFRPWWYAQDWKHYSLSDEIKKHYDETFKLFTQQSGIDTKEMGEALKASARPERKRKPRKDPPPDAIRKLRNPEIIKIRVNKTETRVVTAEKVFEFAGNPFYAYYEGWWIVTDTAAGAKVAAAGGFKSAIRKARENLDGREDHYLELVKKLGDLRRGETNHEYSASGN